ncbi:hypothetical protein AVEN_22397-1 [Araneus ventricosus]|uniref:Uncharacterized protein n=1 Tax=Araneus ventricosus TaxID=182803 RepID=A0A4Y2IL34_ARAVE|nr:hypothetical protein AVEN_22397-1 [Araneus ventricosus]
MPRYYTWNTPAKKWKSRIQGTLEQNCLGLKCGEREHVKKFHLTTNMRDQLFRYTESGQHTATLLKISEAGFGTDSNGMITLNGVSCKIVHSTEELICKVYLELLN